MQLFARFEQPDFDSKPVSSGMLSPEEIIEPKFMNVKLYSDETFTDVRHTYWWYFGSKPKDQQKTVVIDGSKHELCWSLPGPVIKIWRAGNKNKDILTQVDCKAVQKHLSSGFQLSNCYKLLHKVLGRRKTPLILLPTDARWQSVYRKPKVRGFSSDDADPAYARYRS